MKIFCSEKILLRQSVLNHRIDLYLPRRKLEIEVDEKGQKDRDKCKEIEKGNAIKEDLDCKFIRINPDEKDFDVYVEIGKIYNHIN